eukprot:jgi/Mesvir1/22890/Mv19413-RA.1
MLAELMPSVGRGFAAGLARVGSPGSSPRAAAAAAAAAASGFSSHHYCSEAISGFPAQQMRPCYTAGESPLSPKRACHTAVTPSHSMPSLTGNPASHYPPLAPRPNSSGVARQLSSSVSRVGMPKQSLATDPAGTVPMVETSLEALTVFDSCWRRVEEKLGGKQHMNFPREIVWLNGAPGSGKGTNTPAILKSRNFQAKLIQMSNLLQDHPAARDAIKNGELVSDTLAVSILLEELMDPSFCGAATGAVVDGFPRNKIQVDCIKLLHDKLMTLHLENAGTPNAERFQRPFFRFAMLYVDEDESVRRQLRRAHEARRRNQRVLDSGVGQLESVRETDVSEESARRRYKVYKDNYDTMLRLKKYFTFHFIDAMGDPRDTEEQIMKELRYQSELELDEETYAVIRPIPLCSDIIRHARQNLVKRLEDYHKQHPDTFRRVLSVLQEELMPMLRRCALSGMAIWSTEAPLFSECSFAPDMLMDVLTERGYTVTWRPVVTHVPSRIDPLTFKIECEARTTHTFRVMFAKTLIRRAEPNAHEELLSATGGAAAVAGAPMAAAVASSRSSPVASGPASPSQQSYANGQYQGHGQVQSGSSHLPAHLADPFMEQPAAVYSGRGGAGSAGQTEEMWDQAFA